MKDFTLSLREKFSWGLIYFDQLIYQVDQFRLRKYVCVLLWFSVFGVRVSLTFHLTCVHIIFSSVWVAKWPPFGKKLFTWLTICSLCTLTICNFSYFPL